MLIEFMARSPFKKYQFTNLTRSLYEILSSKLHESFRDIDFYRLCYRMRISRGEAQTLKLSTGFLQ